jgi:nucleoside-diphosphate-sugar epimerase
VTDTIEGKVLITGASGFIGSWLRDTLLQQGSDVLAIRRPGSPAARTGGAWRRTTTTSPG